MIKKFFEIFGEAKITLYERGVRGPGYAEEVTVEDIYQAFKERMAGEEMAKRQLEGLAQSDEDYRIRAARGQV